MTRFLAEMADTGPWECFQDASYYDMWCVRQAHDRMFGRGFHLVNGDEAAGLRDLLNTCATDHPNADDWRNRCERAEAEATELRKENARLREVGNVLADFAEHANDCAIVTHGVWSDPIPCTCRYTDAWKAWAALGESQP